ncbi:MAG: glycosyl transferase [Clostridia bacterium]|nr:glycosyl transferase [Clostridia bacterium]
MFDSKYLDKGIALYESLCSIEDEFKLYVFAFDQRTYDILSGQNYKKMRLVSLQEFETEQMLKIKQERSAAEYCWTCTPIIIDYVLREFSEPHCTYLDADLYFFASPKVLFQELQDSNKSVIITEHRFPPSEQNQMVERAGKYCVQFNTFLNNKQAKEVLGTWKDQCLDWCFYTPNGDRMGDQKYLESWTSDYSCVHELQHLGGGVAPWNISQYSLFDESKKILRYKQSAFPLVFYHFQNIRYLPFNLVNLRSGTKDRKLKNAIYLPYLKHIEMIRTMLHNEYQLIFSIKKSCYQNPLLRVIQNYVMPFKITSLSDIVSLRKLRKSI